jgi:hypothetical protein
VASVIVPSASRNHAFTHCQSVTACLLHESASAGLREPGDGERRRPEAGLRGQRPRVHDRRGREAETARPRDDERASDGWTDASTRLAAGGRTEERSSGRKRDLFFETDWAYSLELLGRDRGCSPGRRSAPAHTHVSKAQTTKSESRRSQGSDLAKSRTQTMTKATPVTVGPGCYRAHRSGPFVRLLVE